MSYIVMPHATFNICDMDCTSLILPLKTWPAILVPFSHWTLKKPWCPFGKKTWIGRLGYWVWNIASPAAKIYQPHRRTGAPPVDLFAQEPHARGTTSAVGQVDHIALQRSLLGRWSPTQIPFQVVLGLNMGWKWRWRLVKMRLVKWDYCSQYMEKYKMFQTTTNILISQNENEDFMKNRSIGPCLKATVF